MRFSPCVALISILAVGLAASGCRKSHASEMPGKPGPSAPAPVTMTADPNATAASVDGVKMTQRDLDLQLQAVLAQQGGRIPQDKMQAAMSYFGHQIVQTFVNTTLLLNEAKRLKLVATEADQKKFMAPLEAMAQRRGTTLDAMISQAPMGEKAARQQLADGILIEKLVDTQIRSKLKLADADVDAAMAEQEKTRKATRTEIDAIREQLLAGTNFEALAKDRSADKGSAEKGGDLGLFSRGQMVKPFEDAAFSQKIGEIGPVVESQFGFHIIKVTAHNDAVAASSNAVPTPETVQASHILLMAPAAATREALRKEMEDKQLSPAMQSFIEELRAKAKIETIFDQPAAAAESSVGAAVAPAAKPAVKPVTKP